MLFTDGTWIKEAFQNQESISLGGYIKILALNLLILSLILSIKRLSKWFKSMLTLTFLGIEVLLFALGHKEKVLLLWDKYNIYILLILGLLIGFVLIHFYQKAEEEKEKRELEELKQLIKEASKNPEVVDKVADKVIEKAYKKGYKKGYDKGYSKGRFSGFSRGMGSCS